MAYDDSPLRRQDATDSFTAGAETSRFSVESDQGDQSFPSPTYRPSGHQSFPSAGMGDYGESVAHHQIQSDSTSPLAAAVSTQSDQATEPTAAPRDRLAVHWLWELVLLLAVGGLGYLLWQAEPDALRGDRLSGLLVLAAAYGLLSLGAGVTLRAGVPNLAIGPVAVASMIYFAQQGAGGVITPTLTAMGVAVGLGLAVALVVIIFHVPNWAASLAAAAGVLVWIRLQPDQVELAGAYDPTSHGTFLFLSVAAMGMLGGLVGSIHSVRQTLGGYRPTEDPAQRRFRPGTAVLATGAIMVSMAVAVPAGVLLAAVYGEPVTGGSGLELTALGMALALVGGTSVFGRRGGVLGGTLAVLVLVLFHEYQSSQGWQISLLATTAVAIAIGLVASRLVETFGRRRTDDDPWAQPPLTRGEDRPGRFRYMDSESTRPATALSGGWAAANDSWSSALPAQPAPNHSDPWSDDRWRSR